MVVLSEQIIPCNFVVLQSLIELRSGSSTRAAYQASLERVLYLRCTVNTCLKHSRPRYHRTRSSEKAFHSASSSNQASCVSSPYIVVTGLPLCKPSDALTHPPSLQLNAHISRKFANPVTFNG